MVSLSLLDQNLRVHQSHSHAYNHSHALPGRQRPSKLSIRLEVANHSPSCQPRQQLKIVAELPLMHVSRRDPLTKPYWALTAGLHFDVNHQRYPILSVNHR